MVICHNVLEYVADPAATARVLAGLLRPSGILSLLVMNSDALPLREVLLRGDPEGALAALGQREFTNRFGIVARTFSPGEARELATAASLTARAWYGVRQFYDYIHHLRKTQPDFYDAVRRLELATRATDPYRLIARDLHIIAEVSGESR